MSGFNADIAGGIASMFPVAGVEVIYQRGSDWVKLLAVQGQSKFRIGGVETFALSRTRDWILRAEDLVLAGQQTEPRRGDTITVDVGNKRLTYSVTRPDDAKEQPFRYVDHAGMYIRVHTTLKGVALK